MTGLPDNPLALANRNSGWRGPALASILMVMGLTLAACSMPSKKARVKPARATPGKVVVVVSNHTPVFQKVAAHLKRDLGSDAMLYYLPADSADEDRLSDHVGALKDYRVVAVGLPAALWAKRLDGRQVVFCQVFNYRQHGLVTPRRKGVSSVPPPRQLFSRWKKLSPELRRVIVMSGRFHEDLVRKAQLDAARYDIKLDHVIVGSDKEFVYKYKSMAGKYQGIWLLPDNRVLSRRAMREVMSYSVRHGKQAMVFSPQLLSIGGLISAEPRPEDVATQVLNRLRSAANNADIPGPDVTDLTRTRFKVNNIVARQLGLKPIVKKRNGA